MTDNITNFPLNKSSFSSKLTEQPYPFCEINLLSGRIIRFLPEHPDYPRFLAELSQRQVPIEIITDISHIDILYEQPPKNTKEILEWIDLNTFSNEALAETRGYQIDPLTGDFSFAKNSEVYQDHRLAFSRVGLDIDLITSVAEFEDNALRLYQNYKAVVTERLLKKPFLTATDKFKLGVFTAETKSLWIVHKNLSPLLIDKDDEDDLR